jgi:hypothetical protein
MNPTTGFIFYPGGLVDPRAYAPPAHAIAAQGYVVVIVKMIRDLAVLSADRADRVISDFNEIKTWVISGHSLGGSFACYYAFKHPDKVDGVVLWAAWPPEGYSLAGTDLKAISIYGTKDGHPEDIKAGAALLPEGTPFVEIEGGNHTQCGYYWDGVNENFVQDGDNPADISREEQQRIMVQSTLTFLNQVNSCNELVSTITPSSTVLCDRESQTFHANTTCDGVTVTGSYTWEIAGEEVGTGMVYTFICNEDNPGIDKSLTVTDTINGESAEAQISCTVNRLDVIQEQAARSRWVPLPGILTIVGDGTDFILLGPNIDITCETPYSVFLTGGRLVFPVVQTIQQPIIIMPSILLSGFGLGSACEICIVSTFNNGCRSSDSFRICPLPFPFDRQW